MSFAYAISAILGSVSKRTTWKPPKEEEHLFVSIHDEDLPEIMLRSV